MRKLSSPLSWFCFLKYFSVTSSSSSTPVSSPADKQDEKPGAVEESRKTQRKPGGWKTMPYILGNETFERLATFGLLANFTVYLLKQYHMDEVFAANVMNIWSGTVNFAPLIGAFLSDAYLGKFRTLAYASLFSLLGMVAITSTAMVPALRPAPCSTELQQQNQCSGPTAAQLGFLYLALGFLTVGGGGIRPCSMPFGTDQFDSTTEEGRKGINSFFNWYYFTFTIVIMISLTLVVYIQDSISWAWGFGIPTILMFCSIILFFLGMRVYVYIPPEGSVFSGVVQVFVAAYKKRKLRLPSSQEQPGALYDPPMKGTLISKLPLTQQFRVLNKAAIIAHGEVQPDGSRSNQWSLCSIQQVEEVKCLIRVVPIWASCIICFTAMAQQWTFTTVQALKMDRHLGPKFQIPAGSLMIISMITIGLWLPFYDRVLVPALRRVTKQEGGITLLQRIGIGMVFAPVSMVVAGLVEKKRRSSAISHARPDGMAPISVLWLAPQLVLMGFAEAFSNIGQIEFYYKQFPEQMRSMANALFFCTLAGSNYLNSLVVTMVHLITGKHGQPKWLDNNINAGRLDYFYFVIAALGILNIIYYLICARYYHYKGITEVEGDNVEVVVQPNSPKKKPHRELEIS
ncbi:PREDICTED: protein NRT1/ PTR FAMILY 2.13 [Nelumbo nucifera]|uniref:Protein NRT1/ PTR FAMILY 2.13 n=1 Tax=Nelumbo nucifera TaxID=4432 RepID=A0A1U8A3C0_NELNU|nr:PREDICTED: protein NRT1/ PTR FAMILY 2.13 [Nelumbo nucifera]